MIQKHYFIKSILFKRLFLLASFLCLAGATAWSQDTLTVSGTQIPPFKVYDGSILAAATPGSLMGVAADDTVFIAETYAYYGSAVVGMNKPVIISYILGGPQAEEYVVKNDTLSANIVVRPLGITGIQITPKVYDHNIGANLDSLGHLTNVVEGDSGLVFVNISCSYVTGNAGTFSPVAMQYSIYGPASFNYAAPASDTLFGMVLPRTIYASGVQAESTKVYDGTSAFVVTNHGVIDPNNVLAGDTVYHTAFVNAPTSNQTNGFSTQLNISFHTYGPQGGNYVILDTVDVLWGSISKLALYITDPSIRTIKEYDGTNIAEVVTPAIPLNLVEGDSITITTTATYDDAEVGFEKPITIHHVLSGPQALNYRAPADAVITGSIIMPTVFDTTSGNAFHAVVNGYCEGDSVKLAYHLISGYPVAYSLVFSDEAIAQGFQNSTWTPCTPTDSIVSFPVPANCAGGSYQVAITFTNLASVNSTTYTVPFTINLTNKYLIQVFDDVLSIDNSGLIDNQPDRFTSYKWYHNGQLINETKPYHQEKGGLTGTYHVIVNAGTADENLICPWDESMYIVTTPLQVVHVNPSPVINQAQVKLQGEFESETHLLRVYNSYGTQVLTATFSGRAYTLDMSALPQGTYLINVDGATAKTIKL